MNLIVPIAGKSSRFPNLRPKWMLTHPMSGNFMGIEAIKGLNLKSFDKIYFVGLQEHEIQYNFSYGLKKQLNELNFDTEIILLNNQTKSQSETVYFGIKQGNIQGSIFIKDSDNYFNAEISSGNKICYYDLSSCEKINAKNKSYISLDKEKYITNIVEKKIISSTFSVGGYGFEDADTFCNFYEQLIDYPGECYISNVIYQMLLKNYKFLSIPVTDFEDWGTLKDWNEYKKSFNTIFIDLDGTLVTNTSAYCPPFIGQSKPLQNNIDVLTKLHKTQKSKIIITTSRSENFRKETIEELNNYKIPFDILIMGLPHSQRTIINDFASSNGYPTAIAINISRNSDNLKDYINET
jgi:hypothetical protein